MEKRNKAMFALHQRDTRNRLIPPHVIFSGIHVRKIFWKHKDFKPFAGLLILLVLFFSGNSAAARTLSTEVITVFGSSRIYTDVTSAKNAAVSDCLVSAVEIAVTRALPASTLSANFEAISGVITGRSREFILDYKVLKEIKASSDYRVLVQATVSMEKLSAELAAAGIIAAPAQLPRVLFLMAEQQVDDLSFQYWWRRGKTLYTPEAATSAMIQAFTDRGFSVLDHRSIPPEYLDTLEFDSAALTDEEAAALGAHFQAGMVVTGTAVVTEIPNRMGETIRTFNAAITARAILTDTGETIATLQVSMAATHTDPGAGSRTALSEAGRQAGMELASRIQSQWRTAPKAETEITITLTGIDLLPNLVAFRNALKEIPGVSRHQSLEMTPRQTVLSVTYAGTPRELADAVLIRPFEGFGINIEELTDNHLRIILIPR
jgi:hypothetical protein